MAGVEFAERTRGLRPTVVNAILKEVDALKRTGREPKSLMRGEPDFPTPKHIVSAAQESLSLGRTRYPNNRGEPRLRKAVQNSLQVRTGVSYCDSEEILITTGATFGIYAALSSLVNPGDEVLLPEPVYDAYHGVIRLLGGRIRPVSGRLQHGRFVLDLDQMAAISGSGTRVLILNNPWNPTGTVFRRQELERIMAIARDQNLWVISDEIYDSILYGNREHVSPASVSQDARERTIIVNSLSKTYAMTGWRLGYCAGPSAIMETMFLVLQQSSRGPLTYVQDAASAALEGPQETVVAMRQEYERRCSQVCEVLDGIPSVSVVVPEGGFFAMLDVRELAMSSDRIRRKLLQEYEVVVVHGAAYGESAEGTLRVSFASGGDNLQQGLLRLRKGLSALAAGSSI